MPCAADAEYRLPSMWLVWLSTSGAGHGCVSAPGTVVPTSSNEPQIEEGPIWAHFAGLIEQAVTVAPITDVIRMSPGSCRFVRSPRLVVSSTTGSECLADAKLGR